MRIGLVCPYAISKFGGVQHQVVGLATAYAGAGHDVVVVAPDATGDAASALLAAQVEVHDLGPTVGIRANGSVAPITLRPSAALAARSAVAGVDVVHLHEPLAPLASWGIVLAPTTPVVATFHRAGGGAWLKAVPGIRRLLGRRVDRSFAVSLAAQGFARLVSTAPTTVLFNGVVLPAWVERPSHAPGSVLVAFVGRHEHRKGLDVLLAATDGLADVDLEIAGGGPETDTLRAAYPATPHRRWLGAIDDAAKDALLARADVVCLPARGGESFGIVVLEAMAAGAVAVVSDIEGYRDAAGGHAALVAPDRPDLLRATLAAVADDVRHGVGLASAGRRTAARAHAEAWGMDRLAAHYLEVFAALVGDGRSDLEGTDRRTL